MAIGLYESPKPREIYSKFIRVTRSDTTSNIKAYLPKGAILVGMYTIGGQNSNAGTTATLNVGTTSGGGDLVGSMDLRAGANGFRTVSGANTGSQATQALTSDFPVWATYAETGTASTLGGPWVVRLEYVMVGPGEDLYS